jgi:hypothetical protein
MYQPALVNQLTGMFHLDAVGKQPKLPVAYKIVIDMGAGDLH